MLSWESLVTIRAATVGLDAENSAKLDAEITRLKEVAARAAEEERRRSRAIPIQVPNFHEVRPGTLVVRSEHWKQQKYDKDNCQIGMLTEIKIYKDDLNGFSVWPMVHWEGDLHSSLVHPINVALKSGKELPIVTINDNQQN